MQNNSALIGNNWVNIGTIDSFAEGLVKEIVVNKTKLAVTRKGDKFGVISGVCNHIGGPLGHGKLDNDYVVCPWHFWKFHF